MDWFSSILLATFLYGLMNFSYKIAAVDQCPAPLVVNRAAIVVASCAACVWFYQGTPLPNPQEVVFFAALNSTFFALGSMAKITALKTSPASHVFPITKLNAAFVVIYALVLFDERPSFLQWFGIALSLSIIFIAGSEKNDNDKVQKVVSYGLLFALASGFCTSISMLTGKFAVMHVAKLPYMTISYTMVALFTGVINRYRGLSAASVPGKQLFYYGGLIGIFNFLGYFLVLHAFATGPLSLIQGIFANSFTIPVILSALIYREEITKRRVLIVMLALLSVLFIKL